MTIISRTLFLAWPIWFHAHTVNWTEQINSQFTYVVAEAIERIRTQILDIVPAKVSENIGDGRMENP